MPSFDMISVPCQYQSTDKGRVHTLFNTGEAFPILVCLGIGCPLLSQSPSKLEDIFKAEDPVWRLPTASSSKDMKRLCALWMMKYSLM
jgi:hypothetical protein